MRYRSHSALALTGALVALALPAPADARQQSAEPVTVEVEVATIGIELTTGSPVALLRLGWDEILPILIGEVEAAAIARVLFDAPLPRPMTHDLMVNVLDALGGELEEVRVTELRENTFFGLLIVRTENGVREIDTRPSDALALAVRTGARVRVARHLLEELPDLDFVSMEGGRDIARVRAITVGAIDAPGVEVLHVGRGVSGRGLEPGDRIRSVAGGAVRTPGEFVQRIAELSPTAPIELERERNGRVETIRLPPPAGPGRVG